MAILKKRPLIGRVPSIWRRLDLQGTLEGFLEAEDNELIRLAGLIRDIPAMRNPDHVPDRYLRIAGANKGHAWRTDKSFEWNRHRIATAISRYSYKGSYDRLGDELRDINADGYHVQDQASRIIVLSRQGGLSKAKIVDSDFWHEGVFVIYVQDSGAPHVNPAGLEMMINDLRPAGQMWFTVRSFTKAVILEALWRHVHGQTLWTTDTMNERIGHGKVNHAQDNSISVGFKEFVKVRRSFFPIEWMTRGDSSTGRIGHGILGSGYYDGVVHGHSSGARVAQSFIPVKWHTKGDTPEGSIGYRSSGGMIHVSYEGQRFYRPKPPRMGPVSDRLRDEIRRTFVSAIWRQVGQGVEGKLGSGDLGQELWLSFRGTRFYNPSDDPGPSLFNLLLTLTTLESRQTLHAFGHGFDITVGVFRASIVPLSGACEVQVGRGLTEILPFGDSSHEETVEALRRTSYLQNGSVFQGLLTTDSNLPANIDFPVNTGHTQNYLTEEEAAAQVDFQISTYFFINSEFVMEGQIQRN